MTTSDRKRLSVAFVGHQGCGKSTILGHILLLLGHVDAVRAKKIDAAAIKKNARAARFAMSIDEEGKEWEQGRTLDSKMRSLETASASLTLVDTPGSPDLTPATVAGLAGADAMVLVVDASEGPFEEGIGKGGQAREAALIAYALGVRHAVVAITQLDCLPEAYGKRRFDECKAAVARHMKRVGFVPERIACVPVSGLQGDNLVQPSTNMPWFTGATLLEAVEQLETAKRPAAGPLRCVLFGKRTAASRVVCQGRIESGCMRPDMALQFVPGGATADVKLLEANGEVLQEACAGDVVAFSVATSLPESVGRGTVASEAGPRAATAAAAFTAQLIVLNTPLEVTCGHELTVDIGAATATCRVAALQQTIDRRSGKILDAAPECFKAGDVGFVRFEPLTPVCVEAAAEHPTLGRFCVRHEGRVVAVGLVRSVDGAAAAQSAEA